MSAEQSRINDHMYINELFTNPKSDFLLMSQLDK